MDRSCEGCSVGRPGQCEYADGRCAFGSNGFEGSETDYFKPTLSFIMEQLDEIAGDIETIKASMKGK